MLAYIDTICATYLSLSLGAVGYSLYRLYKLDKASHLIDNLIKERDSLRITNIAIRCELTQAYKEYNNIHEGVFKICDNFEEIYSPTLESTFIISKIKELFE
jgi:hypothetical protein